jgi:hypothetical protein
VASANSGGELASALGRIKAKTDIRHRSMDRDLDSPRAHPHSPGTTCDVVLRVVMGASGVRQKPAH